jgi:hypothetical protein
MVGSQTEAYESHTLVGCRAEWVMPCGLFLWRRHLACATHSCSIPLLDSGTGKNVLTLYGFEPMEALRWTENGDSGNLRLLEKL